MSTAIDDPIPTVRVGRLVSATRKTRTITPQRPAPHVPRDSEVRLLFFLGLGGAAALVGLAMIGSWLVQSDVAMEEATVAPRSLRVPPPILALAIPALRMPELLPEPALAQSEPGQPELLPEPLADRTGQTVALQTIEEGPGSILADTNLPGQTTKGATCASLALASSLCRTQRRPSNRQRRKTNRFSSFTFPATSKITPLPETTRKRSV